MKCQCFVFSVADRFTSVVKVDCFFFIFSAKQLQASCSLYVICFMFKKYTYFLFLSTILAVKWLGGFLVSNWGILHYE